MHTYFDLISLPLSYLNFPHLSFFARPGYLFNNFDMYGMQYIFVSQNFAKVFLIVFTLILHMGYAPLVLYIYQKMFQGGEHSF